VTIGFVTKALAQRQAVFRGGSIVAHRTRAEIDREFAEPMGAPGA